MFLVECFAASADEVAVARAHDRLRSACADLRAAGAAIEYLGALLVPQDELVFHVVVSPDVNEVRNASRRAALHVERIVESLAIGTLPEAAVVVPGPPERRRGQGDVSPRG